MLRTQVPLTEAPPCRLSSVYFFPPNYTELRKERNKRVASAVRICEKCVDRNACLETAINNGETEGVWGGFDMGTPRQRRHARSFLETI